MTNASVKTNDGRKVILYRSYTSGALSSTLYSEPTKFIFGMNNSTGLITSTDLDYPVPVANGTVCDSGANTLTGSLGGTSTTNNTTTYKEGAGASDNTAQNLITAGSNATKQWTKATLTNNVVATSRLGVWLYIRTDDSSATYNKLLSSGTAVEFRFGSDASNYYKIAKTAADLTTGWNFITTNKSAVNTLTAVGTPGTLSRFDILIYTNSAGDAFTTGDVVYDLLRTWTETETLTSYDASYPTFDYTNMEVTRQITLSSALMDGFTVNAIGTKNADTTKLLTDIDTITSFTKDSVDQFTVVLVDRVL
jgi:hypothetical protein